MEPLSLIEPVEITAPAAVISSSVPWAWAVTVILSEGDRMPAPAAIRHSASAAAAAARKKRCVRLAVAAGLPAGVVFSGAVYCPASWM